MENRKVTALEQYNEMRVVCTGTYFFEVVKLNSGKRYSVDLSRMTCTCPDYKERAVKCKHIWRVELEGYEAPEEPAAPKLSIDWDAEAGVPWFDSRNRDSEWDPEYYAKYGIFLVAPGRKKQYKFWAAFPPLNSPQLILYWGDVNEGELNLAISQKINIGQGKVVQSHAPYAEALRRMKKKKDKGYYVPDDPLKTKLQQAIVGLLFARGLVPASTPTMSEQENKPEKEKKTTINWEANAFSWF